MPELRFSIRWPDGRRETCYSPSTVIREYFAADRSYPVAVFVARSKAALAAASERVRAVHGHPCALALGQLARIEAAASAYAADEQVVFESFGE